MWQDLKRAIAGQRPIITRGMVELKKKLLVCVILVLLIALAGCTNNANSGGDSEGGYTTLESTNTETPQPPAGNVSDIPQGEFSFSAALDENGSWPNINMLDYVQMFNYQAFPVPADVYNVPEQEVQDIVDNILLGNAVPEQIMDRPVQDGDTINIDFVGSIDGEEFEGGNTFGMGTYVTIGETAFIGDFLEQLIGHMPGTVVNVEVPFPDDYWEESLAGLDALFVTPINYIAGEEIMPQLTDEFVASNFYFLEISTVSELNREIETSLRENAVHQYVVNYLRTHVTVSSVPENILRHYEQMMLEEYVQEAAQFGMEVGDMLAMFGFESVEELFEASREEIMGNAKFSMIMQAVAEDYGFTITMDDIVTFFIDNVGTDDITGFEEMFGLPWLKQYIRNHMMLEYIIERVVSS